MNKQLQPLSPRLNNPTDDQDEKTVVKVKGEMTIFEDHSVDFKPTHPGTGEPLYKEVLAKSKYGSIKRSEKSAVMTVVVDGQSQDLPSTLLNKATELVKPMADVNRTALELPDIVQHIGKTPHSNVYLHNGTAIVITKIGFEEPNPKVADLVKHASEEQLKFIRQYLDPESVYQMETADVCALLRQSKQRHADAIKSVTPKKTRKKKNEQI